MASCPNTQEVFESLGLLNGVLEFAEPALATRFYDSDGQILRESEPSTPVPGWGRETIDSTVLVKEEI